MKATEMPDFPNLAVRPIRWKYVSWLFGKSKEMTNPTPSKSIPLESKSVVITT